MPFRLIQRRAQPHCGAIIRPDEVHLWQATLASPDASEMPFPMVLDHSERLRAERFRFAADRRRFIQRHILLRTLLAQYLGIAPAEVEIRTTDLGKPYLAGYSPRDGVTFNLSHSGNLVAIAIGRDRPVGVDIEQSDRAVDGMVIARQYFSRSESSWLAELPADRRPAAFLRLWTAREALLKATAHGLTVALNQLELTAKSEAAIRVSHPMADSSSPVDWSIWHRSTSAGALVAVAARGSDWTCIPLNDCQITAPESPEDAP